MSALSRPVDHDLAVARFLRTISTAALELARVFEAEAKAAVPPRLDDLGLGSLQRLVAGTLLDVDESTGASPREIARSIKRDDEPNVRTALLRLEERSIAERVPNTTRQRWRLTPPFRTAG